MVKTGDKIQVNMSIAATVPGFHRFTLGSTIRHVATNKDFNLPLDHTSLRNSDTGNGTFFWLIPNDALTGSYSIIAAVWEGDTDGVPFNRLDDRVIPNAFIIE